MTSVEFKPGARFDPKLMKGVTGGDPLTAAAKYEGEITFAPTFALWLAANDAPKISEDDDGMWRRVRRVPFTHSIPLAEQDPTVQTKIVEPEHAAAVLAWAVAGCLAWQRDGLGSCAAIDRSSSDYRKEMDRVEPFFDECCEFDPTKEASASTLRERYEAWCTRMRVRPVTSKEMAAKLRQKSCDDRKTDGRKVWTGLRVL